MSAIQVFWKHCGKRRNCLLQAISQLPIVVFHPIWRTFYHFNQIWNCCLKTPSVWKNLKFVLWEWVNPLPDDKILPSSKLKTFTTKMSLWLKRSNFSLKGWTLWDIEEVLVTGVLSLFPKYLKRASFSDGKITHWKLEIHFEKVRETCKKRRKSWFPAISPFSTFYMYFLF